MSTYFINQQGERVDVICDAIGSDVELTALSIDEAVNYDLFAVRGRSLSLTFLTGTAALYYNSLRGVAISIEVEGTTVFAGVISTTPTHQPYNYKLERYTIYADDSLTSTKYAIYAEPSLSLSAILSTYLSGYTYTAVVGIDMTATMVTLEALTDTETSVFDMLSEVAKLLNVEVTSRDQRIGSALLGTPVTTAAHFATTQLGVMDAIHSASVEIVEVADGASDVVTPDEPTADDYTWGTLHKETYRVNRGYFASSLSPVIYAPKWPSRGLFSGVEYTTGGLPTYRIDVDATASKLIWLYMAQYWRSGTRNDTTYLNDATGKAEEVQMATRSKWCTEEDQYVEDVTGLTPLGTPSFEIKTVVTPLMLMLGASTTDMGIERALAMRDIDIANPATIYFTRSYAMTLPPLTTYKPRSYLLINASFELYPVTFEVRMSVADDPHYPFTPAPALKYRTKTPNDLSVPAMRINVRLYDSDGTLVHQANDRIIRIKVDTGAVVANGEVISGADIPLTSLSTMTNVSWDMGIDADGWAILLPDAVTDVARVEVDFCGIGGFVGTIYNNTRDGYDPSTHSQATIYTYGLACPEVATAMGEPETVTQIQCCCYSVNLSVSMAAGYLAEDPPAELDTTPAATPGEEVSTWLYWTQDGGIDEVLLSNRLNSLFERAGSNTVKVGEGYLGKVSSTLYQGSHYVEEYQLATIVDQRSTTASVVQIDCLALNRVITYNSVTYRLCGYSYDLVRGIYRCSYMEIKACTTID